MDERLAAILDAVTPGLRGELSNRAINANGYSKYQRHQGDKEKARRIRQAGKGKQ